MIAALSFSSLLANGWLEMNSGFGTVLDYATIRTTGYAFRVRTTAGVGTCQEPSDCNDGVGDRTTKEFVLNLKIGCPRKTFQNYGGPSHRYVLDFLPRKSLIIWPSPQTFDERKTPSPIPRMVTDREEVYLSGFCYSEAPSEGR